MQAVSSGLSTVGVTLKSGLSGLMNLTNQGGADSPPSGLNCISFNQDYTSLGVGNRDGYKLFAFNSINNIEETRDDSNPGTRIIERLFQSSLVAIVSMNHPRKLKVCHFKKHNEICNYSYVNTILGVKLNRQRLIVCVESQLFIHNIRDMKVIHIIKDTPPNPNGLFALSTSPESLLAYPMSDTTGQVQIFDTANMQSKMMISAHENPLAAITFNEPGTKLATASIKGTVIRIFNVVDGTKLYELRRGIKRCALIYSLAFSVDSLYLACSSTTETVHVFKLEEAQDPTPVVQEDQSGFMGLLSRAVSASASYLPYPVTEMLSQERAFATATLPFQGTRNVCAISYIQKEPKVVVASTDGILYIYNLNTTEGGECQLIKQHRLDVTPPECENSQDSTAGISHPGTAKSLQTNNDSNNSSPGGSYAKAVKCSSANAPLTEEEKMSEISAAVEPPPEDTLKLNDEEEYPPVGAAYDPPI